MSRYAVTYRIDGGPGLNGWAERTCHGVSVYANKDDMTPVNGATIVTYSDVPTEVHVVPTTKDCNGDGSVSVYDKCAVNLLEQIERNTRMATTAPTTQPRSVAVVSTGQCLLNTPTIEPDTELIIGNTYLFRRVPYSHGADDFSNVGAPDVQSFGTFVATGTTPNIWKATQVWDVTSIQPAVLYNTTGFDISASYVEYGEYDIVVKIESSQPIFDRPASFTTYGSYGNITSADVSIAIVSPWSPGNIISIDGGTVIAPPGGRVFHETFKL